LGIGGVVFGNVAVAIPVKVTLPPLVCAIDTGCCENDKIGPFNSTGFGLERNNLIDMGLIFLSLLCNIYF
jgi:hypothetical protein